LEHRNHFDSLHQILPGKHFYQFYKGSGDFLNVMIPYLDAGLRKGEACLWLISKKNGIDFSRVTAESLIPGFSDYLSSGQFQIIPAEDWYLSDDSFSADQAVRNIEAYIEGVEGRNFKRFRVAGDIGGVVPNADWPYVEAYEQNISSWLKAHSIVALCAYPILECPPSRMKGILDFHEDVLIGKL